VKGLLYNEADRNLADSHLKLFSDKKFLCDQIACLHRKTVRQKIILLDWQNVFPRIQINVHS